MIKKSKLTEIKQLIILGDYAKLPSAIAEGVAGEDITDDEYIYQILNESLIKGIDEAGYRYSNHLTNEVDMLLSCKAMNLGIRLLYQYFSKDTEPLGKIIIGSIQNDLHEFGKNIVKMMLECAGFTVIDLGVDTMPFQFINAFYDNPDTKIICCSCTVFDPIHNIVSMIKSLYRYQITNHLNILNKIKLMIGGQALTETYCQKLPTLIVESITNDTEFVEILKKTNQSLPNISIFNNIYYAQDAFLAVQKAKELVGKSN